jgi:hypothetical protein
MSVGWLTLVPIASVNVTTLSMWCLRTAVCQIKNTASHQQCADIRVFHVPYESQ